MRIPFLRTKNTTEINTIKTSMHIQFSFSLETSF